MTSSRNVGDVYNFREHGIILIYGFNSSTSITKLVTAGPRGPQADWKIYLAGTLDCSFSMVSTLNMPLLFNAPFLLSKFLLFLERSFTF